VAFTRAELAEAERTARAAAESANRVKSDFLAMMSHELRTPLSAIIGYASLLADGVTGDISDAQQRQVARISASARHLLALIEDVLRFTQLEARSSRPELRPIDVADVVREAATMIEPIVLPQGLMFEVELPAGPLEAVSDARHLRQILLNLLGNAVKFTPSGGRITMRASERDDEIELSVSDTGIGIAPEHHTMIFEPFQQVDQRYSRRVGGVGVGLSIVRHLVQGLGSSVSVNSTPGRGTTFIVRLPRASCDETAISNPEAIAR
jgi:signal transduction histidine kinase